MPLFVWGAFVSPYVRRQHCGKLGENTRISESFGCIVSLLQHSFGGETYGVNIYGKAVKDKDSGIWNVSDKLVKSALIPLSGLSSPL